VGALVPLIQGKRSLSLKQESFIYPEVEPEVNAKPEVHVQKQTGPEVILSCSRKKERSVLLREGLDERITTFVFSPD